MKRVGIITSGGDAPGTNAALRAASRFLLSKGVDVQGICYSWSGVITDSYQQITRESLHNIIQQGGTILKSERTPLLTEKGDVEKVIKGLEQKGIEGVLLIGGEGSHKGGLKLAEQGFPIIGIPKTIDNDVLGTDYTIGFQTAVQTATDAIDRIRTTTESNDRVMIVEVMGRHAGWIATFAGIASGADMILIPERRWDFDLLANHLEQRHKTQKRSFSLIVVAEGASESKGTIKLPKDKRLDHLGRPVLGGIGHKLAQSIEELLGYSSRSTNLGYLLRGGVPIADDRILATKLGVFAAQLLLEGSSGISVGEQGKVLTQTSFQNVTQKLKTVPNKIYELATHFF